MSNHPAGGLPDYFAMFQSMFAPAANAQQQVAANPFALLDPKELERKINETETVLAWLKGTVGMVEVSLQTMRYQQSLLASFAEHSKPSASNASGAQPNMEEFAKMAGAMNPAMWALNLMQSAAPASAVPASSTASTAAAPAVAKAKAKAAPKGGTKAAPTPPLPRKHPPRKI